MSARACLVACAHPCLHEYNSWVDNVRRATIGSDVVTPVAVPGYLGSGTGTSTCVDRWYRNTIN